MKFTVLKELPQGQQPGDEIDVHEDVGQVLVLVGAARPVEEPPAPSRPARGRYRRADLRAESRDLTAEE